MIVHLNMAGQLSLAEPNDFKRLHCAFPRLQDTPDLGERLRDIVEMEGTEDAWIGLNWMRDQAAEPRAAWLLDFERMIDWAKSRGWVSPDGQRVKAHVIWDNADPQLPR